jgi:hypothetical protein
LSNVENIFGPMRFRLIQVSLHIYIYIYVLGGILYQFLLIRNVIVKAFKTRTLELLPGATAQIRTNVWSPGVNAGLLARSQFASRR